ncbi:MAG: helix-turn-helix domain-containing protein [Candidatus Limnocylindrales bacterium]
MDDLAIGRSIRAVRVKRGWRQEDLAIAAGLSRASVSRIELGQLESIQIGMVRKVCATLGIRLTEARWQGAELDRLLGSRHSAMHEELARLFASLPDWVAVPEVTFAIFGERGAIDLIAWHAASRSLLVIELKTEIVDVQAMVATLDRKVRLAGQIARDRGWVPATVSSWLVVADGPTNRRHVQAHVAMLRAAYPVDGRSIAGWLRRPVDPIAALSFIAPEPGVGALRSFAPVKRVRR